MTVSTTGFLAPGVHTGNVADDIPTDARDVLSQLLAECAAALDEGDCATARDTIGSAQSVATNKLPEGDLRGHLLHGCERTEVLLHPEEEAEIDAASEYVAAMRRRLPEDG